VRLLVLALGIVVIVSGVAGLIWGEVAGGQLLEEIERSFHLAPGQEIVVQSGNGPITYEAWDGDQVVIRAVKETSRLAPSLARWVSDRSVVEIEQVARGVRAVHRSQFRWGWFAVGNVSVSFVVRVPRGWEGDVTLQTSNGRISAYDLHGVAELRTLNGPIIVERQSGSLRVKTSNGPIQMKQLDGVVDAETSNGAIIVDGAALAQSGRLRTSNGAVELRAELVADASYEVRTSNGEVRLYLVEPDVQLDLTTSNGEIELGTEVVVTEVSRSRLSGRIGQGTARLVARTSNGDVTISAVSRGR